MADLSYLDFLDELFGEALKVTLAGPSLVIAKRVVSFTDAGLNRRNTATIHKITEERNVPIILGSAENTLFETEVDAKYVIIPIREVEVSEDDFKTGNT